MQQDTFDLFADQGPEFAPQPDRLEVVAGKVVATTNKPSTAQRRFNTLMDKLDTLQRQQQELRQALDTRSGAYRAAVAAFDAGRDTVFRHMVLLLDARIQAPGKGLTATQKRHATSILLGLWDGLEGEADDELRRVVQRYAPDEEDDADLDSAVETELMQSILRGVVGNGFAQGRTFESPEQALAAAMEHARQQQRAQAEKREARKAKRRAKNGLTAKELAQEQAQLDAQGALRTVYRQLASALHPDRESDADVRAQKTALMSEVNAAYERQDLGSLLRIQLQSEMVDASKAATLSEAKLKALCDLLTGQVQTLEADTTQLRLQIEVEFGYSRWERFDGQALARLLEAARSEMQAQLEGMRTELQQVQADDKALKAWIKAQVAENKARLREEQFNPLDDVFAAMARFR